MTIKRINVNGPAYTTTQGVLFDADAGEFSGVNWSHARAISGTEDDTLHQTGKQASTISASIPVDNGTYDINLYWAEHVDHLVASGETLNITTLQSDKANIAVARHWQDATIYDDTTGDIYFFWVETGGGPRRLMCNKNGGTAVELANDVSTDNHGCPSVGMDKNGYIHCLYDLHQNRPALGEVQHYIVSRNPRDIGTGIADWHVFNEKYAETDPPNTTVLNASGIPFFRHTYPRLYTHPTTKELFYSARVRVNHTTGYPFNAQGSQALCLGHLEVNNTPLDQNWAELGGSSHANYPYDLNMVLWNNSSKNGGPGSAQDYQEYQDEWYINPITGRMHVCMGTFVFSGGSGEISGLCSAYSDDPINGTWRKHSDDSVIANLPIQYSSGQDTSSGGNGDIVATDSGSNLGDSFKIYADEADKPYIGCRQGSTLRRWTVSGGAWTEISSIPAHQTGELFGRGRAFASIEQGDDILRTYNGGTSFTRFDGTRIRRDSSLNPYYNAINPDTFLWSTSLGGVLTAQFTANDIRLFGVELEGSSVDSSINITEETGGPDRALVKTYQLTVTDGVVNIDLNGELSELATLSAVEIIELPLPFTANDTRLTKIGGNNVYKNDDAVSILGSQIVFDSVGTNLTVSAVSAPINCNVVFDNGNVTFTPATDFFGHFAQFTATITDGTSSADILVEVYVGIKVMLAWQ